MKGQPFLRELANIQTGNSLYANWLNYALSLSRDDVLEIVEGGLTYQAEALRSMVREIIANQPIQTRVIKKLDLIVLGARKNARALS